MPGVWACSASLRCLKALRYLVLSYVTRPTTINAMTETPANTPRPTGNTESFVPGRVKFVVLGEFSAAALGEVALDEVSGAADVVEVPVRALSAAEEAVETDADADEAARTLVAPTEATLVTDVAAVLLADPPICVTPVPITIAASDEPTALLAVAALAIAVAVGAILVTPVDKTTAPDPEATIPVAAAPLVPSVTVAEAPLIMESVGESPLTIPSVAETPLILFVSEGGMDPTESVIPEFPEVTESVEEPRPADELGGGIVPDCVEGGMLV